MTFVLFYSNTFYFLFQFFNFHFALMQNETKDQDSLLFFLNSTFYFTNESRPQAFWILPFHRNWISTKNKIGRFRLWLVLWFLISIYILFWLWDCFILRNDVFFFFSFLLILFLDKKYSKIKTYFYFFWILRFITFSNPDRCALWVLWIP